MIRVVLPGGDYTEMGLAATTVASSFGKVKGGLVVVVGAAWKAGSSNANTAAPI